MMNYCYAMENNMGYLDLCVWSFVGTFPWNLSIAKTLFDYFWLTYYIVPVLFWHSYYMTKMPFQSVLSVVLHLRNLCTTQCKEIVFVLLVWSWFQINIYTTIYSTLFTKLILLYNAITWQNHNSLFLLYSW